VLAFRDCGFDSHRGNGCLSLVNVVCLQIEVPATCRSVVQRGPLEYTVEPCASLGYVSGLVCLHRARVS
jgi:hypothetical protein